jgi:hypothetical protein
MRSAKAGRNSLPLLAHTPIVRRTGSERILFAAGERDAVRSPSSALHYRQRATSKLSPKPVPKLGRFAARPETRAFAGDSPLGAVVLTTEPLPTKERLSGVGSGNKNAHLRAVLQRIKPSDGLEPSTPSLPWKFRRGKRVHARSLAGTFVLQTVHSGRVATARA